MDFPLLRRSEIETEKETERDFLLLRRFLPPSLLERPNRRSKTRKWAEREIDRKEEQIMRGKRDEKKGKERKRRRKKWKMN